MKRRVWAVELEVKLVRILRSHFRCGYSNIAMGIVLTILITTIIILIYNRFTNIFSYWRLKRVPFVQPLKVNNKLKDVLLSRIDLEDVFEMVYSELEGHELGGFYQFLQPCLMVRSPDVIETILVTRFDCFHDNWSHVCHEVDPLASRSLFFMTGDRWKNARTHLEAAFTTVNIEAMFPLIVDVCKDLQRHLEDIHCKESLRKWPVDTAMMKVCTRPCILRSETEGVCTLEVGTPVVIPVLSIHRDPEHYPDPDKFDPERFSEENFEKRPRFSYLPFGAGPRGCLGSMLAVTQIKSAVVTILSHFKISTSKKTISTVTLNSMTNRDIWLVFEKRNASELF